MENKKSFKPMAELCLFLIAAAGCCVRLIGLGGSSLTLNEAENALSALRLFSGEGGGPLLYTLPTALVFKFFGTSEFTARLIPALAGIILMLLPLFVRKRFGRGNVMALMLVLALDPVLLFWSKRADAVIPAAALTGAALLCAERKKPAGALAFFLIALCGGERAVPAVILMTAAGLIYAAMNKTGLKGSLRSAFSGRRFLPALIVFLMFVTALTVFPQGIGIFCDGIGNAFRPASDWAQPGFTPVLMAVLVYSLIPFLLFCISCRRSNRVLLFCGVPAGSVILLCWQGLPALVWINVVLWVFSAHTLGKLFGRIRTGGGFVFYLSAAVFTGAYSFFYFRLVEMFNQKNGSEPVQLTWNGTVQTLPLTKTGASMILTAVSILIIGLIVKILLGFFDSASVRRGLLLGCVIICGWGWITNVWNTGGFDRIGDHPASPHLENSRNVLNGNYTSLTDSPLFMLIGELRTKHGDVKADNFGLDLIADDPLLDWQLRDQTGFRRSVAELTAAPDSDVILARSDSSFSAYGYAGTVIQDEEQMHWECFSFTEWGRWLLFGDGTAAERNALTLWAKGDMVYSADE